MISVGLRGKALKTRLSEHETFEDLSKVLDRVLKDKEHLDAVIRLPDDDSLYELLKYQAKIVEDAARTAQLVVGAVVPVWVQTFAAVDGPGWRVMMKTDGMQAQAQPQPGPPNGMRLR
jgi:hypothetical protein